MPYSIMDRTRQKKKSTTRRLECHYKPARTNSHL